MNTKQQQPKASLPLKVGSRIRLIRRVDRFPHFTVPAGKTGTCTNANTRGVIAVRMDDFVSGAQEWSNEVLWEGDAFSDFDADAEVLPTVHLVIVRCAGDNSYLTRFGRLAGLGDTFTLNRNEALHVREDDERLNHYREGGSPVYYLRIIGSVDIVPTFSPIRVFNHATTGCSYFMLQDTLWGAPTNADGTADQGNAMPVKDWDEPLDEDHYQDVCGGLGIPVPAITFEATLQFKDGTIATRYGRGNDYKEQNAYDLITQITQMALTPSFTLAERRALVAAVIHALGHLLFAQPDATHRQNVSGTSLKIVQSRGL